MKILMHRHYLVPMMVFSLSATPLFSQVVINELSASNLSQFIDNHSDYNDFIELYNTTGSSVNLAGYYLSDDSLNNLKWQIPSGISIAANGYLRFWASGRNVIEGTSYHTNFRLKQTKNNPECVALSNSSGVRIDYIQLKKTQLGHSYGRITNGSSTWGVFTTPTPNASNNTSTSYTRYADRPDFSMTAGFYSSSITVSISSTDSTFAIRYTTDGTLPTISSTLYTAPITISTTKVLKAITISGTSSMLNSFIEFATYFINVNHTLPVVSITGTNLTSLANGNGSLYPNGSFELFGVDKLRKSNTYGQFNKHGQDSWVLSQRSLDFIARDEMGYNHSIEEKLFTNSTRTNFQRIILRAGGDDNYPADHNTDNLGSAHLRDAFIHNLADKGGLHLDVRRGSKCIVYLNNQYWGVYDLRENPDEHDFTDYYYGQDKFNLQYIERWGSRWAEYGGQQAMDDWDNFYAYIMGLNMSVPANYQYVTDRFEVKSLVDYFLVNMFTVCSDWLIWNTAWWRGLDTAGNHQKWGYILWDNDATFGHYINYTGIPNTTPSAEPCDPETGIADSEDPDDHIGLLLHLKDNPDFYQYYITRQFDLWNTVFGCDNMLAQLDSTVAVIDPEMAQHGTRWSGTYSEWQTNVQTLRNFIIQRCSLLTNGFINCWNVTGPYDLVVDVDLPGSGTVNLNSLNLTQFPWNGTYFGAIENKFQAVPADQNTAFSNWSANTNTFSPSANLTDVTVTLAGSDTVTAHFEILVIIPAKSESDPAATVYPSLFRNEINIRYYLPDPVPVTIRLLSLPGKEIIRIAQPEYHITEGLYSAKLDLGSAHLPDGMYMVEFTAGSFKKIFKVVSAPK